MRHQRAIPPADYSSDTRIEAPNTSNVHQSIVRMSRNGWQSGAEITIILERTENGVDWIPVLRATDKGGDRIDEFTGLPVNELFIRHRWVGATKPGRVAVRLIPSASVRTAVSFDIEDEVVGRGSRSR